VFDDLRNPNYANIQRFSKCLAVKHGSKMNGLASVVALLALKASYKYLSTITDRSVKLIHCNHSYSLSLF
jgi:hypothetical protein